MEATGTDLGKEREGAVTRTVADVSGEMRTAKEKSDLAQRGARDEPPLRLRIETWWTTVRGKSWKRCLEILTARGKCRKALLCVTKSRKYRAWPSLLSA